MKTKSSKPMTSRGPAEASEQAGDGTYGTAIKLWMRFANPSTVDFFTFSFHFLTLGVSGCFSCSIKPFALISDTS